MDYKKIIKNREVRLKIINLLRFIPDKFYLKLVYKIKTGKKLNLKDPKGFNEKLNWLKINDQHYDYTLLVDKLLVREDIKEKIGEKYLIPLIGSWERFSDINFDNLPNKFVLKCNHDSGSVKIITDKNNLNKKDIKRLKKFFDSRLKINSFYLGREYPYKNVKPRIICEKYIDDLSQDDLKDYKFFCFNGEPIFMFVASNRFTDVRFDFFDMNFTKIPVSNIHPTSQAKIQKPYHFEEMKNIAKVLSAGKKFVRIDLYSTTEQVYFGEYTFFHGGGFYLFEPEEFEYKFGDLIKLNN